MGPDNLVTRVIRELGNLSDTAAHINLLEAYDTTYGIYDHQNPAADPMAIMLMHPHEDTVTDSTAVNLIFRIMASKLPEYTGSSITELLQWPNYILQQLLKKAEEEKKVGNASLQALQALTKKP